MSNASQAAFVVNPVESQTSNDLRAMFEQAKSHLENGHAEQALPVLRDILSRYPNQPDALNFASVAFGKLDMLEQAEQFSRQAIALRPTDPGFHLNLANRLREKGKSDEALEAYEQAIAVDPGNISALKNLLRFLVNEERWSAVPGVVDRLVPKIATDAELLRECAEACIGADDKVRALEIYKKAVDLEPDQGRWLRQLARLAMIQNDVDLARRVGERALEAEEDPEMRSMLASIMHRIGDLEAMEHHLNHIPESSDQAGNAANLLGMLQVSRAKIREGLDIMAATERLAPDAFALQATRVMYLNYDPDLSQAALKQAHIAVGQHFARSLPELEQKSLAQTADPDRRLRIAFVSPDFRTHSVAYFALPYFQSFDRANFDVLAYAHVSHEDAVSATLKEQVTQWRNIVDMSDQALADQIRADRIDILIDLAGYTRDTRLRAFTARPAPIQMTYIGYPNTTGMPAIDYRITDWITDPENADEHYTETLIRQPGCFLSYAIPAHAPALEPGPIEHRDYVTFGSFNNFAKINLDVIRLWADAMQAVPDSRLLLKSSHSNDKAAQAVIRSSFAKAGIDPARITFCAYRKSAESHLAVYNDVDIALDTFPYNGTTTTCEALWMGVPVVTLCGERHASRVGASLLRTVGFPAGIAESADDYVLTARLLAENPRLLKTIRYTLRDSIISSPLCDGRGHAAEMERMFRSVWRTWCAQQFS